MKELHATIHGRVQMVMFRDFVRRNAKKLGLTGWVHNEPNGTVRLIAQGEQDALEKLVPLLHKGSILARVDRVDTSWHTPENQYDHFSITY